MLTCNLKYSGRDGVTILPVDALCMWLEADHIYSVPKTKGTRTGWCSCTVEANFKEKGRLQQCDRHLDKYCPFHSKHHLLN